MDKSGQSVRKTSPRLNSGENIEGAIKFELISTTDFVAVPLGSLPNEIPLMLPTGLIIVRPNSGGTPVPGINSNCAFE